MYARLAKEWREQYGYTTGLAISAVGIIRKDAYSDDVTSDEYDSASEYGLDFEYVVPK
jgi:hypothetical protein